MLKGKALLSMTTGRVNLNGCLTPQHRFVHFQFTDPENKTTRVAFSFDQFAHFLVSNAPTDCTFLDYYSKEGVFKKEVIPDPESVQKRLKKNIGRVHTEQMDRLKDLEQTLYDIVNGNKSGGKKAIRELLHEVQVLKSHYDSNLPFQLEKAQEEVEKIQHNLRSQLTTLIGVPEERLMELEGAQEEPKLLTGEKAVPVVSDYKRKTKKANKPIEAMTSMEVADELNLHLKRLEAKAKPKKQGDVEVSSLWYASASEINSTYISVTYVSYQGSNKVKVDIARKMLEHIRTVEDPEKLKRHWAFQ